MKANDEFFGGVAGSASGFAVQVDQRPKSFGLSADDRNHQWKPERAGANERFWSTSDADPNGQRILHRTGIDRLSRERCAVLSTPANVSVLANFEEKIQLFREEGVVVV